MKMMNGTSKKLELRMYGLVNQQLTGIQKGIQYGHSVVEYGLKYGKTKEYQDWAKNHKTFIILNGGTTNEGKIDVDSDKRHSRMSTNDLGSIQKHFLELKKNDIKFSYFREPDLNDTMTAITFIVDERGFKRHGKYVDFYYYIKDIKNKDISYDIPLEQEFPKEYKEWVKWVGGDKNVFLREFLKQFKLA